MSQDDHTEIRELRLLLRGATDDNAELKRQLGAAREQLRAMEGELEQVTAHRNRLMDERDLVWGQVLSPAPDPAHRADTGGDSEC